MKNSPKYYSSDMKKIKLIYLTGILFVACAAILGIILGSTPLTFSEVYEAFINGFDSSAGGRIFAYVRLPRTAA